MRVPRIVRARPLKPERIRRYGNPRYMELLIEHHYVHHILRMPPDEWPDPVNRAFANINYDIYILMQGPSKLGASGKLVDWDRTAELEQIEVPTLVIGAHLRHDGPRPHGMDGERPSERPLPLYCPNGSHFAMYDDQETYFEGLIQFLREVDASRLR